MIPLLGQRHSDVQVNDTLMDVVPVDPHGPGRHADVVRGSVRRFFQRADPEHRGTVSEERFRAFLRCVHPHLDLSTCALRTRASG
jgi:hypothetical protein